MALALVVGLGVTTEHASAAPAPIPAGLPRPLPTSTQFDITGFLQAATLDQACVTAAGASLDLQGKPKVAHCGGTMMLNGTTIIVPAETIAILPASALTWQELFALAPAPYGPTQTGMAIADLPKPLTTYELQAVGNRVLDPTNTDLTKRDRYIAGLVHVTQQELNAGAGYVNYMNYTTGEMRVGGILGDPTTGARVTINDPAVGTTGTGRYGRAMSPDTRFMVDQDNPTIASATGYPMCFPRTDPTVNDDPLCPQTNRPLDPLTNPKVFLSVFEMSNPLGLPVPSPLDPRVQAPIEVGDYVNFAGTLTADAAGTYISAHTMIANVAIRTFPGSNPAYVSIEVGLMGTGGVTDPGATEASVRSKFEGMTTDATRRIHLYGIAVNPDGTSVEKDLGTQFPGDALSAVPGRWRFRPPCVDPLDPKHVFKPQVDCVYGVDSISPAPREVRAVIEGLQTQNPSNAAAVAVANGLFYGQYHAPIGEYIFPESTPGFPIPANNFETMPFLAQGGYSSFTGVIAGQLNPWPGATAPPVQCVAPLANAGGPYAVGSGGTVTLAATTTGTLPIYAWTAPAVGSGTLSSLTIANPVYTAPVTTTTKTVILSLTVSNVCGSSPVTATINVSATAPPTVAPVAAQTIVSGNTGTILLTGADTNTPASTPLTFFVTQTGTPALTNVIVSTNGATGASVSYKAPAGVLAPPKVITLTITAKNAAGVVSAPVTTTVTINPLIAGAVPVANAGGPYTVNSGAKLTLAGSAAGATPLTYLWTAPAVGSGSINNLNVAGPVFTAPQVTVDTTITLTLKVTNTVGPTGVSTSTATSTVLVLAALSPTINQVVPISVFSGATGTFTVIGADPNTPAMLPLTFTVSQAGAAVLAPLVVTNPAATSARINFTAPIVTVDTPVTIAVIATNSLNLGSVPMNVVVTVKVPVDTVVITNAEYRIGQKRLILSVTSSNLDATLTLLPYATLSGVPPVFDPATLQTPAPVFTNAGAGLYTLTLVGAPQPAAGTPLVVTSASGGVSPAHGLDRIRQ